MTTPIHGADATPGDAMGDVTRAPVVVTGAGSGIGQALAAQLREAGASVIGIDKRPGPDIVACDLSEPGDIEELVDTLPTTLGGLANVAGVPGTAPAELTLRVNVLAPRLLARALSGRLNPGAAVVNVASIAAHRNQQPREAIEELMAVETLDDVARWLTAHPIEDAAAYDTSKRALVDWTVLHAASLLGTGVRCVSVSPGPVETPILADFAQSMGQDSMDRAQAAVGRHARGAEIAAVVAFLLSPGASWVNGIDIAVEGGLQAARTAATITTAKGSRS